MYQAGVESILLHLHPLPAALIIIRTLTSISSHRAPQTRSPRLHNSSTTCCCWTRSFHRSIGAIIQDSSGRQFQQVSVASFLQRTPSPPLLVRLCASVVESIFQLGKPEHHDGINHPHINPLNHFFLSISPQSGDEGEEEKEN